MLPLLKSLIQLIRKYLIIGVLSKNGNLDIARNFYLVKNQAALPNALKKFCNQYVLLTPELNTPENQKICIERILKRIMVLIKYFVHLKQFLIQMNHHYVLVIKTVLIV